MSKPYSRRVEFGETDLAGIMHFSNFFRFMEAAEADFLRRLGLKVSWSENGLKHGFPRVSVGCDFQSPARFEDVLDIAVTLEKLGQKSVTYRFDFSREGTPLAVGRMTSVYCRDDGKGGMEALVIPDAIRAKLEAA
ncbi:MAG: thioesterase family protein [Gemmataceae bacterium]